MLGNLNIKAGESSLSQSSEFNSKTIGGSAGTNGYSANLGLNQAGSSLDQTTFTNSQITANNGTLQVNTGGNSSIVGANLLARDVNLNVGGNLLLKSKQNLLESDSYGFGMSFGVSGGGSVGNGASAGINLANGFQSRAFVDQITSIVGTNSVNVDVANNTNIVGAMVANKGTNGNDLGNLTLNTGSLTYSDLKNYNNSESNNFSANLQAGRNPNNPTIPGNLALAASMNGGELSSDTKATIGRGAITIGGEVVDDGSGAAGAFEDGGRVGSSATTNSLIAGLNRDITQVEQNKRDILTSDFDAEIKIDTRLIAAAGNLAVGDVKAAGENLNSYGNDTLKGAKLSSDVLFGTNLSEFNPRQTKEGESLASKDAVPLTPVWASRLIDENNNEIKDGKLDDHPAPNLWTGNPFTNDTPTVGRNDTGCKNDTLCKYTISDEALHLRALYYGIPGFKSASQFHDAGTTNADGTEKSGTYKFLSIFPYFPINYYGAIGTILDSKNWGKDSSQNSNSGLVHEK